jgi:hypothetical protein
MLSGCPVCNFGRASTRPQQDALRDKICRHGRRGRWGGKFVVTGADGGVRVRVTLFGKPGCHLCDDARAVVAAVAEEEGVGWEERSILDEPVLQQEYGELIPVVHVDGVQHDYWRVSPERLRAALRAGR